MSRVCSGVVVVVVGLSLLASSVSEVSAELSFTAFSTVAGWEEEEDGDAIPSSISGEEEDGLPTTVVEEMGTVSVVSSTSSSSCRSLLSVLILS